MLSFANMDLHARFFRSDGKLSERDFFLKVIAELGDFARLETVCKVSYRGFDFPIEVLSIGSQNPEHPVLGFFAGVHGLERIGTEVVLAHLETMSELLKWDADFRKRLETSRIVFMPFVNPVGIYFGRRSNGNGVDLMRNAPVGEEVSSWRLYSGHRLSSDLPFFRGHATTEAEMEMEAQALLQVVREKIFSSQRAITVDVHSGFGINDSLWFPYSYTKKPFSKLEEVYGLKTLFSETYPHHFYVIEPVSRQYTLSGDPWDLLMLEHESRFGSSRVFLPWTLEMGSWMWLRKNPAQILSRFGLFHPVKPHRYKRILRRHQTLFSFLHRALVNPEIWMPRDSALRDHYRQQGLKEWYLR